jgi:hypothetical protein
VGLWTLKAKDGDSEFFPTVDGSCLAKGHITERHGVRAAIVRMTQ